MRAFRLRRRNCKTGKIETHRDYIGLENLVKHGKETFNRYNQFETVKVVYKDGWIGEIQDLPTPHIQSTKAELCEKIEGKWSILAEETIIELFNTKI